MIGGGAAAGAGQSGSSGGIRSDRRSTTTRSPTATTRRPRPAARPEARPAGPREPAGRRMGGVARHPPDAPRGQRPVHADRVDPRCVRYAEPGHDRVRHASACRSPALHATNLFGAFTGRAVGTALGSAVRATPTIATSISSATPSRCLPAATSLRATIGRPSDPAADLDLFVFNCTSGTLRPRRSVRRRRLRGVGHDQQSRGGRWLSLVDGFTSRPDDDVQLHRRVLQDVAAGDVDAIDTSELRATGASWDVTAGITAQASPGDGSRPVTATSRSGRATGCSSVATTVIIENVGPLDARPDNPRPIQEARRSAGEPPLDLGT